MKALVKKKAEPGIWMEDVPVPKIEDNEVLIKTLKTSICGTDVHIYKWDSWAQKTIPVPLVIGHEYVGIVYEVGKNVKGFKVGDRVSGEGHITCGTCPLCMKGQRVLCPNTLGTGVQRHGCFAEYFNMPAENLFKIPESIPDDVAAIFDPYGNAVHTALSTNLTGEDVLITGAGPIGIMAAAITRKAGARTVMISDPNESRLKLAQKMGATHLVNLRETSVKEEMKKAGLEYGFTVGMEMSGHPDALKTLLETAQNGGHISLLGILPTECTIDWDLVIFKMLRIKGIYGREIFETWFKMTSLIESGLDLNPIITHRFHVDQFEEAFQTMIGGHSGKVILDWSYTQTT